MVDIAKQWDRKMLSRKQFQTNLGKNLFYQNGTNLLFHHDMIEWIQQYQGGEVSISDAEKEGWIAELVDAFLQYLYEVNQYVNFTIADQAVIKMIYETLFIEITENVCSIAQIESNHYARISAMLKHTNPAIFAYNRADEAHARSFLCAEYSPEFQLQILGVSLNDIQEPVLDIGCGKRGELVFALIEQGFKSFGIDRMVFESAHTMKCNWLEYDYGKTQWGTIFSNLSFSSHFLHHEKQCDSLATIYMQKYMEILGSLNCGGTWYYAPSLPMVEAFLPESEYQVVHFEIYPPIQGSKVIKKK